MQVSRRFRIRLPEAPELPGTEKRLLFRPGITVPCLTPPGALRQALKGLTEGVLVKKCKLKVPFKRSTLPWSDRRFGRRACPGGP